MMSWSRVPFGALHGHVSCVSPIWNNIIGDIEALAIFHGLNAYRLLAIWLEIGLSGR